MNVGKVFLVEKFLSIFLFIFLTEKMKQPVKKVLPGF